MNFLEYKNLLESRNIKLFDYQYRISYHRLLNQNNISEQTGGGSLITKLNNVSKNNLISILGLLLSSNIYYVGFFLK
jgi:hypothetical protein